MMTFTQSIHICFIKYFTFSGRATRAEYWWFTLFVWAVSIIIMMGTNTSINAEPSGIELIWSIITFCPLLTVSVRRLHDVGRSGWWFLLVFTIIGIFVFLYWAICPSREDNAYGKKPEIEI